MAEFFPGVDLRKHSLLDADALPTRGAGIQDFRTGQVTVTATEVELKAELTAMSGRKQLIVYPPSAGTIYWGKTGVTSTSGAPLAAGGQPVVFDFDPNVAIAVYAINDGTDRTVKVVEVK